MGVIQTQQSGFSFRLSCTWLVRLLPSPKSFPIRHGGTPISRVSFPLLIHQPPQDLRLLRLKVRMPLLKSATDFLGRMERLHA